MFDYRDAVFDSEGRALQNAAVVVKLAGTSTPATLYSDQAGAVPLGTVVSNATGEFSFFAAAGVYDLTITPPGFAGKTLSGVVLGEPDLAALMAAQNETNAATFAPLFGVIAAETAVGVTPSNTAFAPGDIRRYGAVSGGTFDCSVAISNAGLANQGGIGLTAGTWRVATGLTLTAPITLEPGALISVDAGQSLTVNGAVYAGRQPLFTGLGSVTGTFGNVRLFAQWFGAKADMVVSGGAGTDDGPAINRAIAARAAPSSIYIPRGFYKIATSVAIPRGYTFEGDGIYDTFLNCHSDYTGVVVNFNGVGSTQLTTFKNIAVSCIIAGSPGQGITMSPLHNGLVLRDIYCAGFNTSSGAVRLSSTDVLLENFVIENNTVNLYLSGTHANIAHGTIHGGSVGIAGDNSADTQRGTTEISDVRLTQQSTQGVSFSNFHDAKIDLSIGHDDNSKFTISGVTITGSSRDITLKVNALLGCVANGSLGSPSAAAEAIQIAGAARDIVIEPSQCSGWNKGLTIATSGRNIQVNGGRYNHNRVFGVDFTAWTGKLLQLNGVQAMSNGTGAANDVGINGALHVANQRLQIIGGAAGQDVGDGVTDFAVLIDCDQPTAVGIVSGFLSINPVSGGVTVTGAQAAQVHVSNNW